jgi:hypothetical protein
MRKERQYPRKKRRLTVEFNWDNSPCTGFTYDLSPSGIFVRSVRIPPLGTRLKAILFLPNAAEIRIVGAVVRSYRVPSSLARTIPSGFCLKILETPPESYLQFLASI